MNKPKRYSVMWLPFDSDAMDSKCFDDIDEAREFAESFEHHGAMITERVNIRRDPEAFGMWEYDEVDIED